jgi:hypothetical protein
MKRQSHSKQASGSSSHASPSPANRMVQEIKPNKTTLLEFEESEIIDDI